MPKREDERIRVVVEDLEPEVDCGRFPIKRIVGDTVTVEANVFADGHDEVRALLLWWEEEGARWRAVEMRPLGNDRWRGEFVVDRIGRYRYTVAGEIDRFATWSSDLKKRMEAGQDLELPLRTGALLLKEVMRRAAGSDLATLGAWARSLESGSGSSGPQAPLPALREEMEAVVRKYPDTTLEARYGRELAVVVDRERARFSTWYELFPRSWSATPGQHGTLRDVAARLEYVAGMGFDVLYLPPISPIGESFRKGKNNCIEAAPGDVGSPWAIGSAQGGHIAIDPALGTLGDFKLLMERARQLGIEVALDIAFQCSPDHPWVTRHPEFFKKRPDGSIQYAENPPKKYQDIYPLDFETSKWKELWHELRGVFLYWMDQGVRIFRVDNPHTKAFPFWEWVIDELKRKGPDVLFLAEAFTRPRVMERLAKLGFSQSYTYFAWRNTKQELTDYLRELTGTPMREYFRANFWPNTPDILTETLQSGGLPAFKARVILAGTLGANYGIYGPAFELGENRPVRPGSEEYLNSEKYEIKVWDLEAPDSLRPLITRLNGARKEHRALQSDDRLHFHDTDNPFLICYSKRTVDGADTILTIVNLDPFHVQSGWVNLDLARLGLEPDEAFGVHDLLADRSYGWRGAMNYVELRPAEIPAHLFHVLR